MLKEWPLVAFTILGQMAVGMSLFLFLPIALSAELSWTVQSRERVLLVLAIIFGLLVVATALSFFHLRHPIRARRVLANLRTSWLSREIFFELAFMGLVGLAFALVWTGHAGAALFRLDLAAAIIAGVLFLVSMSRLYMLSTLPEWRLAPLPFVMTTLNLGALLTALVLCAGYGPGAYSGLLLWLSAMLVIDEILLTVLDPPGLRVKRSRRGPSLRPPGGALGLLRVGRSTLLILGLAAIGICWATGDYFARGEGTSGGSPIPPLALACVLVLAGEVAGRFLFYSLVPRPGD